MVHDPNFETRNIYSLAKVFADEDLKEESFNQGSALIGEYFSFQVAYRSAVHIKMRISCAGAN